MDVYTYNNSPEWLAHNAGVADMLMTTGLSEVSARTLVNRLAQRYPADTFEVRDTMGTTVAVSGVRREGAPPKPRRRALGTRSA